MQIKSRKQLEKKVADMNYQEIIEFGRKYNGSFLSLVRPLPQEDVQRFDKMVERYKRLNYHIHQLERPIAINEGLSGIDVIELMAYLRHF